MIGNSNHLIEFLSMKKNIGKQQKKPRVSPPKVPVSYPHLNDIQDLSGTDGLSWAMAERIHKYLLGSWEKHGPPKVPEKKVDIPRKLYPTSWWLMQRDSNDDGRFPRSPLKWVSGNPHVYRNEMCFVIDEALWYTMKSGDICWHVLMKIIEKKIWWHVTVADDTWFFTSYIICDEKTAPRGDLSRYQHIPSEARWSLDFILHPKSIRDRDEGGMVWVPLPQ